MDGLVIMPSPWKGNHLKVESTVLLGNKYVRMTRDQIRAQRISLDDALERTRLFGHSLPGQFHPAAIQVTDPISERFLKDEL